MNRHPVLRRRLLQSMQVRVIVFIREEASGAVVAALDHMLRQAGLVKARTARHAGEGWLIYLFCWEWLL